MSMFWPRNLMDEMEILYRDQNILTYGLAIFFATTMLFTLLILSAKSPIRFFKFLFYIPARKSTTNAVVLGGLVLSISTALTLYFFSQQSNTIEVKFLINGLLLTTFVISVHGYLDDKFEISAKFKLICQSISTTIFLFFLHLAIPDIPLMAITPIIIFWGFGTLNGSNLLDGLDTITLKISFATFAFYFFLGHHYKIDDIEILSILMATPLLSFYIFNRAPAKIHLGEIGGNLLGMCYLFLSALLFLMTYKEIGIFNSCFMSLTPLSLPMAELAISFIRRPSFGRSPFQSDRLHMHHILTLHKGMTASSAATRIALCYTTILIISAFSLVKLGALAAFFILPLTIITVYVKVCLDIWKTEEGRTPIFFYASKRLKKKKIKVIHADIIDNFILKVTPRN